MAVAHQPGLDQPRAEPRRAWAGERLEPFAPLTGIVAVILLAISVIIIDGTNAPESEAPAAAYVRYFDKEMDGIFLGSLLFGFGLLFLLWFAASLRAHLAAAFASAIMLAGAVAPQISGAILADEDAAVQPATAQTLYWVGDGFWLFSIFMLGLWLVATAAAMLRTGTMPKWLGWVTLVMGLLAPWWFVGWAVMFFLMPVWIVLVSILLFRGARAA